MNRNNIRNLVFVLVLVFAANIIIPGTALGLNIKYGYFPDVPDNHWAKQVITKMNLRNVVSGYEENGLRQFKPDKPVKQLEAVIMALRAMGLQDKQQSVDAGRYLPFIVPDWAKAVTVVAVDEGLIPGNQFIWDKEATRAWVAQLLVRMMGKEDEINDVSGEILPYSDSYAIPTEYINYVKVANKYGLIKGNVDNTFQPNNPVTRAQMVAFLSRAESYLELKDKNLIIGEITEINNDNLSILSDDGTEYTLVCNLSTNLYGKNGKEIWTFDLQVKDRVYLLVEGNTVKYLELGPPAPKVKVIKGKILQVYSGENAIVIRNEQGIIETITLLPNTKIIKEFDNSNLTIEQLTQDLEIKISMNSDNKPDKVTVVSNTVSTGAEGIIYSIDPKIKLIALKKADGLSAYQYNDNTQIMVANNRFATIADIREGDKVLVEATSEGILEKITLVASEVDLTLSGIVKQISVKDMLITFETEDNELKALYVKSDANIDFSGDAGTLADILVGDKIEVEIKDGKISRLSVSNRKLHERLRGTVVGTDYSNRILTIKDSLNQLHAYEIESSAEIVVNDDSKSYLHEIKKDMRVELELTDEKITYLAAKNTMEGTVVRVNDKTNIIELTLDTNETKVYTVASDVDIDIEDESKPELDDIKKGEKVEIKLENNKVSDINVERVKTFKVTQTYNNSSKIKVVDDDGHSKYLYIYSKIDLIIPGQSKPKVNNIRESDIIKATYMGHSLQKVEVAPVIIGTVTSVSTVNKTVAITSFDGRSFNYEFTGSSRVNKKGHSYYHMTPINVGDRVAVEENLNGGKVFNIMEKVSGKVGAIYKDKTRIYLQITQTTWKQYDMLTSAYLHQGAIELTPSEFKLNDNVDLYLSGDKVFEVEKK